MYDEGATSVNGHGPVPGVPGRGIPQDGGDLLEQVVRRGVDEEDVGGGAGVIGHSASPPPGKASICLTNQ